MFYFTGLGYEGGLGDFDLGAMSRVVATPFVLASPLLPKGMWWVLDRDSDPWGFVDGNFLPDVADDYLAWMDALASQPGVDANWMSMLGFSAGAYAVTELMCRNRTLHFRGVVVGGVHGHSQPDTKDLEGKRAKYPEYVLEKWEDRPWPHLPFLVLFGGNLLSSG